MQAIELETAITHGEIHIRLPSDITADKAKVIVLFETKPVEEQPSNDELVAFLNGLVEQPLWATRSKEDIDQMLDEERSSWD